MRKIKHMTKKTMQEALQWRHNTANHLTTLTQEMVTLDIKIANKDYSDINIIYNQMSIFARQIENDIQRLAEFDYRLNNGYYVIDDLPLIKFDDFIDRYYL